MAYPALRFSWIAAALCWCGVSAVLLAEEDAESQRDLALEPATVIENPWRFHIPPTKRQGVPGIARTPDGVVHLAVFTEEDVRAGEPVSDHVRLKQEVARLTVAEEAKSSDP